MNQKEFWLQCFAGALHYAPPGQARAIAYEAVAVARTEKMLDPLPEPDDDFEDKVREAAKLPLLPRSPKEVKEPPAAEDLPPEPSGGR